VGRIEVAVPAGWGSLIREQKLAWARSVVEATREAPDAEPEDS
jgi:hypothetical protein